MKRIGVLTLLLLTSMSVFSQNRDTSYVNLTNFKLYPGTFSWRGTNTYYDMTSWDSSPYTEGHLKQGTQFRMNYRLLFPGGKADKSGFDPAYKPGYPLIVMLHGGGERGNCWNGNCYCGTGNGCSPNGTPVAGSDARFLNNDHVLTHGGQPHLTAVTLAGTKKPNDPSLDGRAFPGFVLFPQNVNAWGSSSATNSDLSYAIRIIRLLCRQYNIDENRIYIHGLSLGGQGVYKALNMADWLFAAALPMSGLSFEQTLEYDSVANIPMWIFQGGQDTEPTPSQTEALIKKFRQAGGVARYSLYPTLGHGTWNTAYAEPEFFTWILSKNKANIHVPFGNPNICGTTGAGVNLTLAQGFYAYQWERDGEIIPGANSYTYLATIPGVYRARFSRLSANPTEEQWNRWSDPVTIGEKTPDAPVLGQVGTIVLNDLNNNKNATLVAPPGEENYYWYKNGVLTTLANTSTVTISGCSATTSCANTGAYTVVTAGFDRCTTPMSKPKYVLLGIHSSNITPPILTKPTVFTGNVLSPSSVLLTWNDASRDERGYEIWRRKATDASTTPWKLAVLTQEDVTLFLDTGLEPSTLYYYKIRAVSNTGRSDYTPGNSTTNVAQHLQITTSSDTGAPMPPQNLTAKVTGINKIELSWEAAIDDSGIKDYMVYYNSDSVAVGSNATTLTLTNTRLVLNTIYNFTVRAIDLYGNRSYKSNQVTANTYVDGLYYEHSTGAWTDITAIPFTTAVPEFTGKVSNFTLAPRTQDDFFNFRYYGYLYINTGGTYRFTLDSNDGSELYIDGTRRIQRRYTITDGSCTTTNSTSFTLSAGYHTIEVRYYDYTGSECLSVKYRGPDTGPGTTPPTVAIPDSKLKSYNTITPPTAPQAASNLTATADGYTQINLGWQYGGSLPITFEIYRSTAETGPFTLVASIVSTSSFSDKNLIPGTTYYYKLRSVNSNAASSYTAVASATTQLDTEAPTQPLNLTIASSTFTTTSLVWSASTDNIKVTGYEIWANNVLIGTTAIPGFMATDLLPNTTYTYYVVAVDANNNKSVASNTVSRTTSNPDVYYSKSSGNLNAASTWGKGTDGSGAAPGSFTTNGQYFVVSNRSTSALGGDWAVEGTISKVIVPDGVTLTVDNVMQAKLETQGASTLNINHALVPDMVALSPTSTVNYNGASTIQMNTYGNLGLNGNGNKAFPSGTVRIDGNLTVGDGITLKGALDNASKIVLSGDLIINGTPGFTAPDFGIQMEFGKNGIQKLKSSGDVYFYSLKATSANTVIQAEHNGSPYTINLGSFQGGGVSLPAGTTLQLGNNSLSIIRTGTINSNGETGRIGISSGDISLTSSAAATSNLYFDPVNHTANNLTLQLTGAGQASVQEDLSVAEGIKIKQGKLNSGGHVTLLSTATKTANILEIENGGSITGDVTVQRYLDPKGKIYRYIASPVSDVKVSDWQKYIPITGNFTGTSTGSGLTKNPSLFYYQEPTGWIAYPTTNNSAPIEKGRGYSVFMRNGTTPTVLEVKGNPYQGNVTFPIVGSSGPNTGWNLLGNPYAATIAWSNNGSAWIKSNIGTTVSVRDNSSTTGQFRYYDAATGLGDLTDGKIAPGQAFWVQASAATASLTVTEKAKVAEQQIIYREATDAEPVSHVRINLYNAKNNQNDPAYIALTTFGTDDFDAQYDALKQDNVGIFNLSTVASGKSIAINNLQDAFCEKQVKLNITQAAAGTYTLSFDNLSSLRGVGSVTLTDTFADSVIAINQNNQYTFNITTSVESYGSNRFVLTLTRPALQLTPAIAAATVCGQGGQVTLSSSQAGVQYVVTDNQGNELSAAATGDGQGITLNIPQEKLLEGGQTVRVKAGFTGCTTQWLSSTATLSYSKPAQALAADVSTCQGTSAAIHAFGAPEDGSYNWYDQDMNLMAKAGHGATLDAGVVWEETPFYVSAVLANGCEGTPYQVLVRPQILETPVIEERPDSLLSNHPSALQWYRDGVAIEGATGNYYLPKISGIYTVAATEGGCTAFSEGRTYVITDVEAPATALSFRVYPNPASSGDIHLKGNWEGAEAVNVKIVDVVGKVQYQEQLATAAVREGARLLPKNNLRAGVYLVMVQHGGRVYQQKLVVQ